MRYFAILKDSFREARDSKVMFVLFALTTLTILTVATISFKPLPAQATMEQFFPSKVKQFQGLSWMFIALNNQELKKSKIDEGDLKELQKGGEDSILSRMSLLHEFRLEKVDAVRGEPDSPDSDYLLTISEAFPRPQVDKPQLAMDQGKKKVRRLFQKAEELGFFKIDSIEAHEEKNAPGQPPFLHFHYRLTLQSTPNTWRIWANEPSILFGLVPMQVLSAPLGFQLYVMSRGVLFFGAWVAILIGVIITSYFIPNMLSKGTVDMLLVKPISRWTLLCYKYIGGLTFIFLCTAYAMGGMWLAIGLRTGLWANGTLVLIFTITYFFAILYAISLFVGVVTRSTIAAIMLTIGAWFAFYVIAEGQKLFDAQKVAEARNPDLPPEQKWTGGFSHTSLTVLHAITPHTEDLNDLNDLILYTDMMTGNLSDMGRFHFGERHSAESLIVSFLWIAVFVSLSCAWFSYKDY